MVRGCPSTARSRTAVARRDAAPEGSWAELIRAERLRSTDELRLVSMTMWLLRVRETRLADYSTFERAHHAGFPPGLVRRRGEPHSLSGEYVASTR